MLRVPLNTHGFFLDVRMKLRPAEAAIAYVNEDICSCCQHPIDARLEDRMNWVWGS